MSTLPEYGKVNWRAQKSKFRERYQNELPEEAMKLVLELLTLDPQKRPSAHSVLDHNWFWSGVDPLSPEQYVLGELNYVPVLIVPLNKFYFSRADTEYLS